MKKIIRVFGLTVICFFLVSCCFAQQQKLEDSLREVIRQNKKDTGEVNALAILGIMTKNFDSTRICAEQSRELSKALMYKKGEAHSLMVDSKVKFGEGNMGAAIHNQMTALQIYETLNDNTGIATANLMLQASHWAGVKDYRKALSCAFHGFEVAEKNDIQGLINFYGQHLAPLFQKSHRYMC
jgi:hypothetical protein